MNKKIALPILTLVIGLLAYSGLSALKEPPKQKEEKPHVTPVNVTSITPKDIPLTVESYGFVTSPQNTDLTAQISGKIVSLNKNFERGLFVKKGDILAVIDKSDYQSNLVEAEANLASAQAALELEKAQGKVARDEWEKIGDLSPSELSLRKPQLAQEIARVKAAKAGVLRAKNTLSRTEIRAPYDAVVAAREISLGSVVSPGSLIGHIKNTDFAEVSLPVAHKELRFLSHQGKNADVVLSHNHQRWHGKIVRNEAIIDEQSRMTYLIVRIEDPYLQKTSDKTSTSPLQFGTYIKAIISGITVKDAIEVSHHLVKNNTVPVALTDNTLNFRNIEVIREQADSLIIRGEFTDSEELITSPIGFATKGSALLITNEDNDEPSPSIAEEVK